MGTIGLIGAGHIGSQIARLAIVSGYNVVISNSRGPETLSGSSLSLDLTPGRRPRLKLRSLAKSLSSRYP
jgi:predicted dinucleotide-binding enzyme